MHETTIIACGVFADELPAVLPPGAARVAWLDTSLHADAPAMRRQIQRCVETEGTRRIRFLVGSACHPDMCAMAERAGSPAPLFANCIEALAGPYRPSLEAGKTMLITPGWVRAWPGREGVRGWDVAEMRMQHGRYDRIVIMDPGINPVQDYEVFELFDMLQVPVEVHSLDLGHFRRVVNAIITDQTA